MKFNRSELIIAVEKTLQSELEAYDQRLKDREKYEQDYKDVWMSRNRDYWYSNASKIRSLLDSDTPIRRSDLAPKNHHEPPWYGDVPTYSHRRDGQDDVGLTYVPAPGNFMETKELRVLQRLLKACDDEYITPTALKNLGFTSAMLRRAVQAMVQEET